MCAGLEQRLTVAGFVLAGGRSSRMGSDKALLQMNGEPLVTRAARTVESVVGSAVIVGDPERYRHFGYAVIQDSVPDCGPLAGIEAALAYTVADWNLIVACDMPGITLRGLTDLVDRARSLENSDVLIPILDGRPQPLCATYHRHALPAIQEALLHGRLKIMDAIGCLHVTEFHSTDQKLFENVNTLEEWSAFVSR